MYKPAAFNKWMNEIANDDSNRLKIREWIRENIPQTYQMQMEMEFRNPFSENSSSEEKFSSLCANALSLTKNNEGTKSKYDELKKMLIELNREGAARYENALEVPQHECKAKAVKGGRCNICES
jgi:hypothetical protein